MSNYSINKNEMYIYVNARDYTLELTINFNVSNWIFWNI